MDHADDVAALSAVIADLEAAFNADDAERAAAHFTGDATAVSPAGVLSAGREALLEALRAGAGQRARYELGEVTFPRPDVALAHVRARALGEPALDHALIALYVFVRDAGRWRIAARQSTLARP
jgi:uncharacterized protein (TIGR02246 family)